MPCAEGELCAQPDKTPQDPHGHGCQGGCGGGCTAFAAAWLMMITKITASAARASPRPASAKRQQQTALGGHNLNARRPRMGGVRSNGCLIFGGALPAVLVFFFFFLATSNRVRQEDRREIDPT